MGKKKGGGKGGGGGKKGKKGSILGLVKKVTQGRQKAARRRAREEAEAKAREAKKVRQSRARAVMPYGREKRVLLVGEGNFSFGLALARLWGAAENLVCTAYDTRAQAATKYPELGDHLRQLEDLAVETRFGVDARELHLVRGWTDSWDLPEDADEGAGASEHRQWKHKLGGGSGGGEDGGDEDGGDEDGGDEDGGDEAAAVLPPSGGRFDVVVWNFPHAGAGEVAAKAVEDHQRLLSLFFASAKDVLKEGGEVHVTVRPGEPYTLWKIPRVAHVQGFRIKTEWDFHADMYPGYEHRRTKGGGLSTAGSHTHVFCRADYRAPSAVLENGVAIFGSAAGSRPGEEDENDEDRPTKQQAHDPNFI